MKLRERALAILLSMVMVLTFMPALAFAGEEDEAQNDAEPAVEAVTEDAAEAADEEKEAYEAIQEKVIESNSEEVAVKSGEIGVLNEDEPEVTGISYSATYKTAWGPSITAIDSNGAQYYDLDAINTWTYSDGSSNKWFFAPGEVLTVKYSDGTTKQFVCKEGSYYDAWFVSGDEEIWPDYYPLNNAALVPGNNTIVLEYRDCTTTVTLFIDTPELQAQRAEAARQGTVIAGLPKVKISKPVAAKKKITVKWKKLTKKQLKKGVTNIEIWVCPNSAFGSADTKIKLVGKKKASAKVTGLKKGTYYVKVRAIKKVGGVKYYTAWSKVKKVKVKK